MGIDFNLSPSPPSHRTLSSIHSLFASSLSSPLTSPLHSPYISSDLRLGPPTIPVNLFTVVHSFRLAYLYHDTLYKSTGTRVGLFSSRSTKKGKEGEEVVGVLQAISVVLGLVFAGTTATALLQGQKAPILEEGSGEVAAVYA